MLADRQSLGNLPRCRQALNKISKGYNNSCLISKRTRGCSRSGPGDLDILILSSFFRMISLVKYSFLLGNIVVNIDKGRKIRVFSIYLALSIQIEDIMSRLRRPGVRHGNCS